jgi:epoxyqueuosine reductase
MSASGGKDELAKRLRSSSKKLGADMLGIADANGFSLETYKGGRPQDIMPDCRAVLIVGVPILKGTLGPLPKGRPEYTNSLLAATVTLRYVSFDLARQLERAGFRATIVPAEGSEFGYWYVDKKTLRADVSLRYAAYLAGLGSYGLSNNLITEEFGPRVRLMGIVTDAPLPSTGDGRRPLVSEKCKDCLKCVEACPAGALTAEGEVHRERCREYMFTELAGLRCGLCIKACPYSR